MTGDNYKVGVAGSFWGQEEMFFFLWRGVGVVLKQIQMSLRYVRHLPDDDVAPLSFAHRRFHLRSPGILALLRLIVLSITWRKSRSTRKLRDINLIISVFFIILSYILKLAFLCYEANSW